MAPRIQWSTELVSGVKIVPRLEDRLIDELFYQEDEIGEFRHTAFMIECGLEEDPPDGPDVPPVPWGDMLLKQQKENEQKRAIAAKKAAPTKVSLNDDRDSSDGSAGKEKRLPSRSRSNDDIDTLAIELTSHQKVHQKSRVPKRTFSTPLDLHVGDGHSSPSSPSKLYSPGSARKASASPRKPERRVPTKAVSDAAFRSPPGRPKRSEPSRGSLTQTNSGTLHGMTDAAARAKEKLNSEKNGKKSEPNRRLTKTRSGTCHEMAIASAKARRKMAEKANREHAESILSSPSVRERRNSIELENPVSSPSVMERRNSIESNVNKNSPSVGRPAPIRRSLVATKSGTVHGMRKNPRSKEESNTSDDDNENASTRIVYKNGKRTTVRRVDTASRESSLKSKARSKSSDSGSDKDKSRIIYRNGKREVVKRVSSASDSSFSDDNFLGDIVADSDDGSIARSDISISTCSSEDRDDERHASPRKPYGRKPMDQQLTFPVRRTSLTKNENESEKHYPSSPKSIDIKKKKKKKKKKESEGLGDSKHSIDSISSVKKKYRKKKEKEGLGDSKHSIDSASSAKKRYRKKKEKESKDDDGKYNSYYSPITPVQRKKKQSEAIYGDVQPGAYPSPSSIRSQHRKRMERKTSNESGPSIIKIEKQQTQPTKPDDFLGSPRDPLAALKKKKEKAGTTSASATHTSRPDDWLGSPKAAKRTWRVKEKK